MKYLKRLGFIVLLWTITSNFASAQFTLLPSIGEGVDCEQVLAEYDVDGNFKHSGANAKANEEAEKNSSEDLKEKQQAYNDAVAERDQANQQVAQAQKALDSASALLQACKNESYDIGMGGAGCVSESQAFDDASKSLDQANTANAEATAKIDQAQKDSSNAGQISGGGVPEDELKIDTEYRNNVLACAIKTGKISLSMIPYYIAYIADFLLGLSAIVSILFIMVGGYFYIWGGLTDNKEKGKKTVINAMIGLAMAIFSWAFISAVISALTS